IMALLPFSGGLQQDQRVIWYYRSACCGVEAALNDNNTNKVLVLDDEPLVLDVVAGYLASLGMEVTACGEIESARAFLSHHRFAAVLTDLRVSALGGLEGIHLVRYVATHFPKTKVITMSGYVTPDVRAMATAAGAAAIVEKPLDFTTLGEQIRGDHITQTAVGPAYHAPSLEDIIAQDRITSFLQPIVKLDNPTGADDVLGFEALARVDSGSDPVLNPEIMFDYATQKQRLLETDLVCIRAALRAGQEVAPAQKLFINAQPRSMSHRDFEDNVLEMVVAHEFTPSSVVFEITEQRGPINQRAFLRTIDSMRAKGFGVALDDYGEGFATLELIDTLRPDFLKIGGNLCRDIDTDVYKQTLLSSTTEMAYKLGIPTIQECIESRAQLNTIRKLGVEFGQGFYFAKPKASAEALSFKLQTTEIS
ncbi:MAG: EAL domain-containing response regulator, partial [Pseudomonadota bacterium]